MWENVNTERSKSFIEQHFGLKYTHTFRASGRPAITISRQEGAGGLTVASNLAGYLRTHTASHEQWTVFSQHLVAKVLEEYHHQKGIGDFMKEDHKGFLTDAFEELLGLHPSTWTLVEQTNATILRLAEIGNVILIGRGGNVVTGECRPSSMCIWSGRLKRGSSRRGRSSVSIKKQPSLISRKRMMHAGAI